MAAISNVGRKPAVESRRVWVPVGSWVRKSVRKSVCLVSLAWEPCDERGSQADTRSRGIDGKCADYFRPDECRFRADDYPGTDWMALLRNAAQSPGVIALGAKRGIQLLIGEHDGQVIVVR